MADTSGVNLLTGKVNLSVPLGSISGPAGFGESVSLSYSTTGLLQQIKTWNQDAPTSTVGLGWSFEIPYIYRVGNGSLKDSFYLVSGGSVLPLLFCETASFDNDFSLLTEDTNNDIQSITGYSFVTQATSLLKIIYYPTLEYWIIQDGSGNKYEYGKSSSSEDLNGQSYNQYNGCAFRIRWCPDETTQLLDTSDQPYVWTGSSAEPENQKRYVDVWHIAHKTNESNQRVNYFYDQFEQGYIGRKGKTKNYAICVYPVSIKVEGGGKASFEYKDKYDWEYPPLKLYDNQTNAFQVRRETQFLDNIKFYDVDDILQNQINLGYDFLYKHFDPDNLPMNVDNPSSPLDGPDVQAMNKRLLTYIDTLTNIDSSTDVGIRMAPPQEFDYWGLYDKPLQDQVGGKKDTFKVLDNDDLSLFNMTNFGGSQLPAETDRSYNALFGHLKTVKLPTGALRWYSYSDNSLDFVYDKGSNKFVSQVKSDWMLKLDTGDQTGPEDKALDFLVPPPQGIPVPGIPNLRDARVPSWRNPKPYWGADGYVIIQWHTFDQRQLSPQAKQDAVWICLQIYEWMGKWVPVTCRNTNYTTQTDIFTDDLLTFKTGLKVSDLSKDEIDHFDPAILEPYAVISMGSGKFGLVRSNIETTGETSDNPLGNLTLFHRDLHMPGLWNSSYFVPRTPNLTDNLESTFLPTITKIKDDYYLNNQKLNKYNFFTYPVDYSSLYCLQLVIGDNVAGLLDVLNGNLYAYNLSNNKWCMYQNGSNDSIYITAPVNWRSLNNGYTPNDLANASAITAYGDTILVLFADEGIKVRAQLCIYNVAHTTSEKAWNIIEPHHHVINGGSGGYEYSLLGIQFLSQDSFVTAQIILKTHDGDFPEDKAPSSLYLSQPLIISWNKDLYTPNINIQEFYSPNNSNVIDDSPFSWGTALSDDKGRINGSVNSSSNLINITNINSDIQKYIGRYVGGNKVGDQYANTNTGWLCSSKIPNNQKDNDPFAAFASFDTTVGVTFNGLLNSYTYSLYQFNPYYGLPSYGSSDPDVSDSAWLLQKNVSLGENFDNERLFGVINKVLDIVSTLSFVAGPIIGSLEEASTQILRAIAYGCKTLDFVINGPLQLASGFVESKVMSDLWRNPAADEGLGQNYLLAGTIDNTDGLSKINYPQLYYKSWDVAAKQAVWKNAEDPFNLLSTLQDINLPYQLSTDNYVERFLSQDVYRYGQSFIPFAYQVSGGLNYENDFYMHRLFSEDKIAGLRNGSLSVLLPLPFFTNNYDILNSKPVSQKNLKLPYSIFTSSDDDFSLYTYWGGILCYQPQMTIYDDGIIRTQSSTSDGSTDGESATVTSRLKDSVGLKLCMYQDEKISGALSDFVVDKVSLDDGYQVYDTHILYKSDRAIYQNSMGTVTYNQVNVAVGGQDYATAAQNNGWTEQYFYNGSSPYTLIKSETDPNLSLLPFDPATDVSNPYYQANLGYTNADICLNHLFGQSYCHRLMSKSGYEMVRQYSYYTAYNQTVRYLSSDTRPTTSIQYSTGMQELSTVPLQTNGSIMTLKLTLSAPDNTTQSYIQELVEKDVNGNTVHGYLTTKTTMLYDLTGVRYLINKMYKTGVETTYETGLLMSQQVLSNHYTYQNAVPLTQSQSTIKETIYAFQIPAYESIFTLADTWLWNPIAQTIASQTVDSMPMFNMPVSASATIWQSDINTNTKKLYWYPQANYRWVGNSQEYLCTQSIPWQSQSSSSSSLKPIGTDNDWQLSSYIREITNGIVDNTVNVTKTISNPDLPSNTKFRGSRTTVIYDKYKAFPIAKVISPNLVDNELSEISDEFTRFCSFEDYEDLSNWAIQMNSYNEESIIQAYNLTSNSSQAKYVLSKNAYYAGSQSLCLNANGMYPTVPLFWNSSNTQATIKSTPVKGTLSFYAMTDAVDLTTASLIVFPVIQPENSNLLLYLGDAKWTIQFGQNNTWNYEQTIINLESEIKKFGMAGSYQLYFSFQYTDISGNDSNVYIDTLSLVPYGSVASFKVYDQQTKLLTASLDLNGTTSRIIYDSRRRMIGSAIGQNDDQAVVSCPVTYYSRENEQAMQSGQTVDAFNDNDPNSMSLIQPAGGGQYFDFRINKDLMDWTDTIDNTHMYVINNSLYVNPNYGAQKVFQLPYFRGVAVRAQVMPRGGYNPNTDGSGSINFGNLLDASMRITNDADDSLSITFNNNNEDSKYQFELKRRHKKDSPTVDISATIPNIPVTWIPDDWLLALIDQSVYFFINGQLILQTPVDTSEDSSNPFKISGLKATLGANEVISIGFSNIMLMQDPRLSTQYTDGTGKVRQTQVVADLPSPPTPPSTV